MPDLQEGITVRTRSARGRLVVSVDEDVDDEALTAAAEKSLLLAGDLDDEAVAARKTELVEKAVEKAIAREVGGIFDPSGSTTLRVSTDRDLEIYGSSV